MCSGFPVFLFVNPISFYCIFGKKEKFSDPSAIKLVSYVCKIQWKILKWVTAFAEFLWISFKLVVLFACKRKQEWEIVCSTMCSYVDCTDIWDVSFISFKCFAYGQTFDIHPQQNEASFRLNEFCCRRKKIKTNKWTKQFLSSTFLWNKSPGPVWNK